MNYEKIITEIKSVREFTKKKVDTNLVSMIIDNLSSLNKLNDTDLEFAVIEDGKKFAEDFDGKIGYFGKIIPAPAYVLVFGKNDAASKINAGYCMEWIRFSLWNAGLGSCWISTVDNVDYASLFAKKEGVTLLGCLGIGEEYSGIFRKNTGKTSDRKGIAEFVYKNSWKEEMTWEELEQLGLAEVFYLTKLAPSWGNEQPWAFMIDKNECKLFINKKEDKNFSIDTGIISLFFIKACETKGLKVKAIFPDATNAEKYEDFECQVTFVL